MALRDEVLPPTVNGAGKIAPAADITLSKNKNLASGV